MKIINKEDFLNKKKLTKDILKQTGTLCGNTFITIQEGCLEIPQLGLTLIVRDGELQIKSEITIVK